MKIWVQFDYLNVVFFPFGFTYFEIPKAGDSSSKLVVINWIPTELKGKDSISTVRNSNFIVRSTNPKSQQHNNKKN